MKNGSIWRDFLILIGILPIPPKHKTEQNDKVKSYQNDYLSVLSEEEMAENREHTNKLILLSEQL
jgi:hypothetical protein